MHTHAHKTLRSEEHTRGEAAGANKGGGGKRAVRAVRIAGLCLHCTISRKMVCDFWIFIALPFKRAARKVQTRSKQDARKIHVTCISA